MQRIPFYLINTSGEPMTGQVGNIYVKLSIDGGAITDAMGTVIETGLGWYYVDLTDTELACKYYVLIQILCEGAQQIVKNWIPDTFPSSDEIAAKVWTYPNRSLVDDISGLYCTRIDVEKRWGKLNVAVMADVDNDGDEFTIANQIKAAIIKATNRINSELASCIYVLPFSPVPEIVKQHAAALSGVELYRIRSVAVTNDAALFTAAETEFAQWVTSVYNGLQIPGAREVPE